jgi:hypothetical protein
MRGENRVGWVSRLAVGAVVVIGVVVVAPGAYAGTGPGPSCRPGPAPDVASAIFAEAAAPEVVSVEPFAGPEAGLAGLWVQMGRSGRLESPMAVEADLPPGIATMLSQNSRGLKLEQRKSGRTSMRLDGRFLRGTVAYIDANGHLVTSFDSDLPAADVDPKAVDQTTATAVDGRELR